jgi:PAS domain S-box-containing protein
LNTRAEPDFRALFESAPGLYLVVAPDLPRYTIVAVSDAYLRATMRTREALVGKGLFEAWPPNPAEPESTGVEAAAASLERVVRSRTADVMATQRHDLHRPEEEGGGAVLRYWTATNSPVLGRDGELDYIIHRAEDVTEQVLAGQAAREALSREERRYRELFESAPDGIFVANPDGRCTDVNAAGCRLLGYTREELLGRSITELVAAEDLARQAALTQHISAGGADVSEWRLRRKDGTYVPVELSANTLPDGRLRAFVRDITERRTAEEARRLSDAMLAGIVSTSADAIISIDEEQRITTFNEGAESIFGYSRADVLGMPLDVLLPARFRGHHGRLVAQFSGGSEAARHIRTRTARIFGLRKNGEEFPADAAISKLQVGGRRLLNVSLRDVSEQTRAEEEERFLAELGKILVSAGSDPERLLGDVAEFIVRGIADWCVVDVVQEGTVRRLRFVHADPAKAEVCRSLERLPVHERRNLVSEVVDTQRPALVSAVTSAYLESIAMGPEHLHLLRELAPTSFIVAPLVARGQAVGTLAFGSSGTSRLLGEHDVRHAERLAGRVALAVDNARLHEALARAVRARDEVLAIVAHDLRNPLNSITLLSRALRSHPDTAARIRREAGRMHQLVQDLLDVARLDAGQKLSIVREPVEPGGIFAEARERHEASIADSERVLEIDAPADLPSVPADRTRVLQVLDNLLGNAIKFARSRITLGATSEDGEVRFRVADDGGGVPPEALPHLFDRFWQATRNDRRGAGLGLWIAQEIILAHGGRIWAESEPGAGTTFFFTLPKASLTA